MPATRSLLVLPSRTLFALLSPPPAVTSLPLLRKSSHREYTRFAELSNLIGFFLRTIFFAPVHIWVERNVWLWGSLIAKKPCLSLNRDTFEEMLFLNVHVRSSLRGRRPFCLDDSFRLEYLVANSARSITFLFYGLGFDITFYTLQSVRKSQKNAILRILLCGVPSQRLLNVLSLVLFVFYPITTPKVWIFL